MALIGWSSALTCSMEVWVPGLRYWWNHLYLLRIRMLMQTIYPTMTALSSLPHPRIVAFPINTALSLPDSGYLKMPAAVFRAAHMPGAAKYLKSHDCQSHWRIITTSIRCCQECQWASKYFSACLDLSVDMPRESPSVSVRYLFISSKLYYLHSSEEKPGGVLIATAVLQYVNCLPWTQNSPAFILFVHIVQPPRLRRRWCDRSRCSSTKGCLGNFFIPHSPQNLQATLLIDDLYAYIFNSNEFNSNQLLLGRVAENSKSASFWRTQAHLLISPCLADAISL